MSSFAEALAEIDVSPLEKLAGLSAEIGVLQGRLATMEEKRASVAEAVYTKVRGDYLERMRMLEQEASPLKQAAQTEFAKLAGLLQRSEADHESVRLQREEVEFRHTLGEFSDKEFKKQLAAIDDALRERATALEQAQALKQKFVDAFGSEEALGVPAPAAEPAAAAPVAEVSPAALITGEMPAVPAAHAAEAAAPSSPYDTLPPAGSPYDTIPPPVPAAKPSNETIPPPSSFDAGATRKLTPLTEKQLADAGASSTPGASMDPGSTQAMRVLKGASGGPPRADQTVIIRGARLVPQNAPAGKLTHTVGLKPVMIGSSEGCDIRVPGSNLQHAEIRVSMAGYTLSDLGGGVRINGVVVEQHLMRHEDVLDIGPARFVFKEG